MTINARHQGVLEITVAPHIGKCCNKAIAPTGFFDEKRQIKIFNGDVNVFRASKDTKNLQLLKFPLELL